MNKILKISAYVFMMLATITIVYLAATLNEQTGYTINVIELNSTNLLSVDQYYKFAKLEDNNEYEKLSLSVIKNRLEKHPYVETATVFYDENNKVVVQINEKRVESILFINDDQYLLTKKLEVLPLLHFTKQLDFPAISNPKISEKITEKQILIDNEDIIIAFRIFHSLKLVNAKLYDRLSEINFRHGGDIILTFSLFNYPIIIGRNDEIRKVVYLDTIWKELENRKISNMLNYIDLRYKDHIFLGIIDSNGEEQI